MANLVKHRKSVLDIGWADKPNSFLNNDMVTGLDLVKKQKPENYSKVVCGNAMDLNHIFVSGMFDAILAGELLEHLENPLGFIRNCMEVLSPGGVLIITTPNPNSPIERILTLFLNRNYFYSKNHVMLYPQRWLIRIMEIGGCVSVKLHSGGFPFPGTELIPFPRPWCYQTIAVGYKSEELK